VVQLRLETPPLMAAVPERAGLLEMLEPLVAQGEE
jgi:hypothetical protein